MNNVSSLKSPLNTPLRPLAYLAPHIEQPETTGDPSERVIFQEGKGTIKLTHLHQEDVFTIQIFTIKKKGRERFQNHLSKNATLFWVM